MIRNFLALQLAIGILGALIVYELLVNDDDDRRRRRRRAPPPIPPPGPRAELPDRRNGRKTVPMPMTAVHPWQRGR